MNPLTSRNKTTQGPTETRTPKTFLYRVSLILWLQLTLFSVAWAQTPNPDTTTAPLLTLDEAIRIASGTNRDIQISKIEIIKAQEIVAQVKTNYLPKLDTNVLAGAPLRPLNSRVPAGSFGTYPATGPIPATDSNIHSPVRFAAFVNASATQPLTQLFKVNLAVKQARLGINLAKEGVRAQSQDTVRQVKEVYYQVAELQAQVISARAAVRSLSELSTLTERRLGQETVLLSDSLTVKAKLKQQRYQLLTAEDAFELQKQNLNRLLGRDLHTSFSVEMLPFGELVEWDLDTARKQALEQRPELRGARLQTKIAELDVRREHAKYIPDLSLQVSYLGFQNVNFLPQRTGAVGFAFQWQPFDWGYKKHRIAELKATAEQKATTESDIEQRILLDVEEKFRKLEEARILLDALADQREAEQTKLGEVTNRYNQKAALLSDLMQQQAAVSQAEAQYQQAIAGFWTARANFEKAMGVE
ncbi:MAG TPA: TolC family protein [Candidatus Acidoferrum sp.]|nr:TolC family protein [Candidatus Acidoferrum sp.]